jgi:type II secretory pathway pseudopilin PulG
MNRAKATDMNKNINKSKKSKFQSGFSILEIIVVFIIICILAAVTITTYIGTIPSSRDVSVQSDIDTMDSLQTSYGTKNSVAGRAYYSGSGYDATLGFAPSSGNIIDVVINSTDYCIRGYNPNGTKNSIWNAFTKESTPGVCSQISPSVAAMNVAPSRAPLSPVADWLAATQGDHYGNYYNLIGEQWATVTRAGAKTIYDPSTQHIYDVPANYLGVNPRSDGQGGNEAVIEGGRTNILLNSDFETDSNSDSTPDNWSGPIFYAGGTGSATINSTQSVHQSKSYKITKTNEIGQVFAVTTPTINTANTYTYSCWVKSNTTSAYIDTYTGTGWSSANVPSNRLNQWTRLSTTFAGTAPSDTRVAIYGASGTAYFDGCQLEVGSFATSYIPTTTTAVTRNADSVTVPTTGWSSTKGSILTVLGPPSITAGINPRVLTAIGSNGYIVFSTTTSPQVDVNTNVNSSWGSDVYAGVISNIGVAGYTWDTTIPTHVAYLNGVSGSANSGVSDTGALSSASFGLSTYGGSAINGSLQRVLIYSSALSGSNITTVTNAIKNGP